MGVFRILWTLSLMTFVICLLLSFYIVDVTKLIMGRKNSKLEENITLLAKIYAVVFNALPISLICFILFVVCDALLNF